MSSEERERPEPMAAFFDERAKGYDSHMREVFSGTSFSRFYHEMSSAIAPTTKPLRILDLGCGTGLEIEALFQKAPNAQITGVDLSANMLGILRQRYTSRLSQLSLLEDSYLSMEMGYQEYDHILSAMTMHHLLPDDKLSLYRKIYVALKPGGIYTEGDSVVPIDMEKSFLADYRKDIAGVPRAEGGYYHIDVPLAIETQKSLLQRAGFRGFELVWQMDSSVVWNIAVYTGAA